MAWPAWSSSNDRGSIGPNNEAAGMAPSGHRDGVGGTVEEVGKWLLGFGWARRGKVIVG